MQEVKCKFCEHILGYENGGKFFNTKRVFVTDTITHGYCAKCNYLNVWSSEPLIPAEEIDSRPLHPEVIEFDAGGKPIKPHPVQPLVPSPNPNKDKDKDKEKSNPVFVVFGNSKVYHSRNHFEDKTEVAKVITDITGYRLCKICDGFVGATDE